MVRYIIEFAVMNYKFFKSNMKLQGTFYQSEKSEYQHIIDAILLSESEDPTLKGFIPLVFGDGLGLKPDEF